MSKYDKKYDAFHLFMEILGLGESSERKGSGEKAREASGKEDVFYEIEYDSSPFPGVGKYVMKSQKIEEPQRDEIRDLFSRMREIARKNRSYSYQNSRFHDNRVRLEDSKIFYEQGMFMKDFEDT